MEPDTAAVAAAVAASDATATIVVLEEEQPGPSTSREEGVGAKATEATAITEKGEKKKEVNKKGVCAVCDGKIPCLAPLRGPNPDLSAPTGTRGAPQGWGRRARGGRRAVRRSLPSPFPSRRLEGGGGAGARAGAARGGGVPVIPRPGSPLTAPGPSTFPELG